MVSIYHEARSGERSMQDSKALIYMLAQVAFVLRESQQRGLDAGGVMRFEWVGRDPTAVDYD